MHPTGGRHELTVSLPRLPIRTTDVFFALSAYNCGNLSLFRKPSIRFFDAFDASPLAQYTAAGLLGDAQAVVAWLDGGPDSPIWVQCIEVTRSGLAFLGGKVTLDSISKPIGGEGTCPA